MADFVLEQYEKQTNPTIFEETVHNYAKFLKQPLKLEMFVPCDDKENVLITPTEFNPIYWSEQYKKAKEKVLFEGFKITYQSDNKIYIENENKVTFFFWKKSPNAKIIEDLIPYNLELTKNFKP